jgi:hypothetical protein
MKCTETKKNKKDTPSEDSCDQEKAKKDTLTDSPMHKMPSLRINGLKSADFWRRKHQKKAQCPSLDKL